MSERTFAAALLDAVLRGDAAVETFQAEVERGTPMVVLGERRRSRAEMFQLRQVRVEVGFIIGTETYSEIASHTGRRGDPQMLSDRFRFARKDEVVDLDASAAATVAYELCTRIADILQPGEDDRSRRSAKALRRKLLCALGPPFAPPDAGVEERATAGISAFIHVETGGDQ